MSISTSSEECSEGLFMKCEVVPERLCLPEIGEYSTYGIKVTVKDYTETLHDVSVSKETSEHIARLLELHSVSVVHLRDVLEDLLP